MRLIEEATVKGHMEDDITKTALEVCAILSLVEKLLQEKSDDPEVKADLGEIKTTVKGIKEKVDQFLTTIQVAETFLSKITLKITQLSTAITLANRIATQAAAGLDNNCATIVVQITSSSTELKAELKEYIDSKFQSLEKFIPLAITDSSKDISSGLTLLNEEHQAAQEMLYNFLDVALLKLLAKHMDDTSEDFQCQLRAT